jgi:hypothetical protein
MRATGSCATAFRPRAPRENDILQPRPDPDDTSAVQCCESAQMFVPERIGYDTQTLSLRTAGDDAADRLDLVAEAADVDAI